MSVATSDRVRDAVAPPATESIATPRPRTPAEQRYVDAILPLVERLVGEGRLLSELGAARSRDLLELRTRAERFRSAASDVTAYETANGIPERMRPLSSSLNAGMTSALAEIDRAQAAVLRFDWDEVQLAVTAFTAAVDSIAAATTQVETA